MLNAFVIGSIVISVAIGYKTKYNTGFLAIAFAYLIGCFILGMSVKDVIAGWPLSTMFVIFSVSLFYNFALVNGTLEKTARYLLYACRRYPGMLPFALYLASTCIAALGAGFFTVMAFMAPVTLMVSKEAKMNPLIGAVAINCGANSGANLMTSGNGIVFRGLMDEIGLAGSSFSYTAVIFIMGIVFSLLLIALLRFVPKGNRQIGQGMTFEKPEPFTFKQKLNLYLMLIMLVLVLAFPILHIILPDAIVISYINSKLDVGLVAVIFSVIALFMKLAPQKEVISKVPWNTIILICGVGMLINVAIAAGTIDLLSTWVGSNLPSWLVPIAFGVVGAVMGFFASVIGVVCPALFPLVPSLAATTGINPLVLIVCIVLGGQSSVISPFSSGGSLILGSCNAEEEYNTMFSQLLFVAVPAGVALCILINFILSLLL